MRLFRVAVLALTALLAPLAAEARAQTFTSSVETARTQDGVTLAITRLRVAGGVPVLLLHGVGSNGWEWDLPSKSFARYLAGRGYDVWIANHRRTGKRGVRSGGSKGYSFDDLVCWDVPALVEKVRAATGDRPFVIGHSMGGMMALAWLEGCAYESALVRREPRLSITSGVRWVDVREPRVAPDAARAQARNASIRGFVAIASPTRFDWPARGASALDFWRYDYWDYNILLRDLSWSPAANAAAWIVDEIPAARVTTFITDDVTSLPYVGAALQPYLVAVAAQVGRSYLSAEICYGPNMEGQVLYDGLALAVDDTSPVIMRQFMDGIRGRTMRESHTLDPLRAAYVYPDHYAAITASALVIGGRYDKLCNDDTLQTEGFARLGSADRTYRGYDSGHVDLVIGRDAPSQIWGPTADWLDARR